MMHAVSMHEGDDVDKGQEVVCVDGVACACSSACATRCGTATGPLALLDNDDDGADVAAATGLSPRVRTMATCSVLHDARGAVVAVCAHVYSTEGAQTRLRACLALPFAVPADTAPAHTATLTLPRWAVVQKMRWASECALAVMNGVGEVLLVDVRMSPYDTRSDNDNGDVARHVCGHACQHEDDSHRGVLMRVARVVDFDTCALATDTMTTRMTTVAEHGAVPSPATVVAVTVAACLVDVVCCCLIADTARAQPSRTAAVAPLLRVHVQRWRLGGLVAISVVAASAERVIVAACTAGGTLTVYACDIAIDSMTTRTTTTTTTSAAAVAATQPVVLHHVLSGTQARPLGLAALRHTRHDTRVLFALLLTTTSHAEQSSQQQQHEDVREGDKHTDCDGSGADAAALGRPDGKPECCSSDGHHHSTDDDDGDDEEAHSSLRVLRGVDGRPLQCDDAVMRIPAAAPRRNASAPSHRVLNDVYKHAMSQCARGGSANGGDNESSAASMAPDDVAALRLLQQTLTLPGCALWPTSTAAVTAAHDTRHATARVCALVVDVPLQQPARCASSYEFVLSTPACEAALRAFDRTPQLLPSLMCSSSSNSGDNDDMDGDHGDGGNVTRLYFALADVRRVTTFALCIARAPTPRAWAQPRCLHRGEAATRAHTTRTADYNHDTCLLSAHHVRTVVACAPSEWVAAVDWCSCRCRASSLCGAVRTQHSGVAAVTRGRSQDACHALYVLRGSACTAYAARANADARSGSSNTGASAARSQRLLDALTLVVYHTGGTRDDAACAMRAGGDDDALVTRLAAAMRVVVREELAAALLPLTQRMSLLEQRLQQQQQLDQQRRHALYAHAHLVCTLQQLLLCLAILRSFERSVLHARLYDVVAAAVQRVACGSLPTTQSVTRSRLPHVTRDDADAAAVCTMSLRDVAEDDDEAGDAVCPRATASASATTPTAAAATVTPLVVPSTRWTDVDGCDAAVAALKQALLLPQRFPAFFVGSRRPWQRVLLYGPPGTGKTLLASAAAGECAAALLPLAASDVLSRWVGGSERRVREAFARAAALPRCVLFLDEVDALCGARGGAGESEVARRVKTELLLQLQATPPSVSVLAATNLPWELDSAVRRRFDRLLYVDVPSAAARRALVCRGLAGVAHALTAAHVDEVVARTAGYTASDVRQLVLHAVMAPVRCLVDATALRRATATECAAAARASQLTAPTTTSHTSCTTAATMTATCTAHVPLPPPSRKRHAASCVVGCGAPADDARAAPSRDTRARHRRSSVVHVRVRDEGAAARVCRARPVTLRARCVHHRDGSASVRTAPLPRRARRDAGDEDASATVCDGGCHNGGHDSSAGSSRHDSSGDSSSSSSRSSADDEDDSTSGGSAYYVPCRRDEAAAIPYMRVDSVAAEQLLLPRVLLCHFDEAFAEFVPSVSSDDVRRYAEWRAQHQRSNSDQC